MNKKERKLNRCTEGIGKGRIWNMKEWIDEWKDECMFEWINEWRVEIDGKIFKISVKLVYKLISDLSSLYPGKQGVPKKIYNFSKFTI